jgi:aspartyl-tRNA(Asn)/glutamyl-tRNA(Gln) amidotransferase subunit C
MAAADFDVKYVANLARIALTEEEQTRFATQLNHILGYIEKLRELNVDNVEPTAHAIPLVNVTRPDEIRPSLPHEDAMRNAPSKANELFLVPKIVE